MNKSKEDILAELVNESARLMEVDATGIDKSAPLISLGMDSVYLTQFKEVVVQNYDVEIDEEILFSDKINLELISSQIYNKMNGIDDILNSDKELHLNAGKGKPKSKKKSRALICC